MNTSDHSRAERLIFQFRISLALDSAIFLEIVVKPLNLNGRQFVQHDFADTWNDVVFNIIHVVLPCVWPDTRLGVNLIPCSHPRRYCVIPGLGNIQPLAIAYGGFQFFFDLSLGSAKDIFRNALSSF